MLRFVEGGRDLGDALVRRESIESAELFSSRPNIVNVALARVRDGSVVRGDAEKLVQSATLFDAETSTTYLIVDENVKQKGIVRKKWVSDGNLEQGLHVTGIRTDENGVMTEDCFSLHLPRTTQRLLPGLHTRLYFAGIDTESVSEIAEKIGILPLVKHSR